MEVDYNNVKKREWDLIHFNGWIPFEILMYIDNLKRNNYLKSVNLFDDVQKRNIKERQRMKKSDDANKYLIDSLEEWINDNPRFRDCVILE